MPTSIARDDLSAALDSLTVVDALPPAPYGQRHLPGAINLVQEDDDAQVLGALPDRAATIVTYSTDADCTRGPDLAARLQALGYTDVRVYREGIADWVGAGLPVERPRGVELKLSELAVGPTAALFEGFPRAGVDISMFVTRTPPGRAVELHVHPYAETFLLLEGRGRWTRGEDVVELGARGHDRRAARHAPRVPQRRRHAAASGIRARARHPAPDVAGRRPGVREAGSRPVSHKPRPRKNAKRDPSA
jgi:rhodanese-related sulfurtransferase